ncbi:MAG: MFS transporter [Thermonemataceae bacterium]|nr:MFS transporter [Thermonemataceae bacterium]
MEIALKSTKRNSIAKQIMSLAALEAAITIGWLAYEKYQPQLLTKFSFTQFASLLLIAQGILGAVFHPLSGKWADKALMTKGTKLPVIISGAAFAAVVFVAVSFALLTNPASGLKWILPILVIFWLAAMATFHSPAISLVESFTPVHKFPQVSAILTMVFGVIYTIEPFLIAILDAVGLTVTFILGGALVMLTALALKNISLTPPTEEDKNIMKQEIMEVSEKRDLFLTGFFVGLFKTLLLFVIPSIWVHHQFFGNTYKQFFKDPDYLQSAMLLFSALVAFPASKLVEKWGASRVIVRAIIFSFFIALAGLIIRNQIFSFAMLILMGIAYGLLAVASLPYILNRAKKGQSGLSVGLYYGGVSASTAFLLLLLLILGISAN